MTIHCCPVKLPDDYKFKSVDSKNFYNYLTSHYQFDEIAGDN